MVQPTSSVIFRLMLLFSAGTLTVVELATNALDQRDCSSDARIYLPFLHLLHYCLLYRYFILSEGFIIYAIISAVTHSSEVSPLFFMFQLEHTYMRQSLV